ncbi:zinc finger protein 596-like [Wyeomyia smithii]|uniref:zinc finger protein 596-like n=1 Tax=Wyeomyia smithii TaxID=174621 RepID=UPI002467E5D4|nr:zinc finger protein 596-like [Wyeomyia smithii]
MDNLDDCENKESIHSLIKKEDGYFHESYWELPIEATEELEIKDEHNSCVDTISVTPTDEPCDKMFDAAIALSGHKSRCTGKPENACEICGKHFENKQLLNTHEKVHEREHYNYETCNRVFFAEAGVTNQDEDTEVYHTVKLSICEICGMEFNTKYDLEKHLALHQKPVIPSSSVACKASVSSVQDSGDSCVPLSSKTIRRPYVCNVCGKCLDAPCSLKRHAVKHSDVKPHECNICSKRFAHVYYLRKHMRLHIAERKFSCDICGKSYYAPCDLQRHYDVHTGKRSHVCTICCKAFFRSDQLKTHMQTNHTEKLCRCRTCGMEFNTKYDRKMHILGIHSVQPETSDPLEPT